MTRLSRRRSLRAKWTLAVLGIVVVPLAVVAWWVLRIQRDGLSRAEAQLEAAVVDEAAIGVLAALEQTSDVAARVVTIFGDEAIDADARTRLIADVVAHAPAVSGVAFFDAGGRFVDAVVHEGGVANDALRAPPSSSRGEARFVTTPDVRYEAPLRGSVTGTIAVALAPDVLGARLRDVSLARFGAAGRVILVDESGAVVSEIGRKMPAIPGAPRGFGTEMILTTELDEGGVHMVGTIRTMPKQRWALVVMRPYDEAYGALADARRAVVVSVLVIALAATIAAAFGVGRLTGHVAKLVSLVARYARRDFSARSDVRTGDELEALGRSLETMADDLSTSERELERRARVEANLRRYVPGDAPIDDSALDLGGAKRRVTIVFADVVAFTSFAERVAPETSVALLNELFTILSEIVVRHGGMVDKFLGDCIMAVFRPGEGGDDDATRALAATEDMHAFVASNEPRWRRTYDFTVELGIGVATGDVLLGNLGSETRMEYTVIGDAANVAARLEALAKPRQTLATREVVEACPETTFASLGEHAIRGKARPIELFEVRS